MWYEFGRRDADEDDDDGDGEQANPLAALEALSHPGLTLIGDRGEVLRTRLVALGTLVLTTERIVACDPYWVRADPSPFLEEVAPGSYPVLVSVAQTGDRYERIICAAVRFGERTISSWQPALRVDDVLEPGVYPCYNVETGTGCFAGADAAAALVSPRRSVEAPPRDRRHAISADTGTVGLDRFTEILYSGAPAAQPDHDPLHDLLDAELSAGRAARGWSWADVPVSEDSGANVIAFSTGQGDGCYPSFFGYDAQGRITCLATRFLRTALAM